MEVVVHEEGDAELTAAAEWYEQEWEGLGDELLAEAGRVLSVERYRGGPDDLAFRSGQQGSA